MRVIAKKETTNKRINLSDNKQHGIVNYDDDNAYPQRMRLLANSSITAKSCIRLYAKYIGGEGFADPKFYKAVINSKGQTVDKILSLVKDDIAINRGFAIHRNVDGTGKTIEAYHVPFEHVRKTTQIKKDETGFDYAIYDNWDKSVFKVLKADEIKYFHAFTLDPSEFRNQIKQAAETKQGYLGQLFYYSADEGSYPLSSCDVAIKSILAEIGSDIKTQSNIDNNFAAKGMLIVKGKFADDEEREEFEDNVQDFIGPDGSQVLTVDVSNEEEVPDWKPIQGEANDKIFEYTDKKVTTRIIRSFLQPKILHSDTEGAGFFNQEQIRDATNYYNQITVEERLVIEETFTAIFSNFATPINPSGDYSVKPIVFRRSKDSGMPTGMQEYLISGLDYQTKRAGLVVLFGIDPSDADLLVPEPEISASSESEKTLKALAGLSPLLANKVLEELTSDEIRALVGLKPSTEPKPAPDGNATDN